jgi:hypothetical protein
VLAEYDDDVVTSRTLVNGSQMQEPSVVVKVFAKDSVK